MTTTVEFTSAGLNQWIALATSATIVCIGSGGNGALGNGTSGGGGGGGGGHVTIALTDLKIGRVYYVNVDGAANEGSSFFGPTSSSVDATCLANSGHSAINTAGGVGGSNTGAIGTTRHSGGAGGGSLVLSKYGGGGGASGSVSSNGSAGGNAGASSVGAGGTTGSAPGGDGGHTDGVDGTAPGAGGGGAGGPGDNVGLGADGYISITFTEVTVNSAPTVQNTVKGISTIVSLLLDPNEVLTGNAGTVNVAPSTAEYLLGFDLTASASGTINIKSSAGAFLFKLPDGLRTNQRMIVWLPQGVRLGATNRLQIVGGADNMFLDGFVFWK